MLSSIASRAIRFLPALHNRFIIWVQQRARWIVHCLTAHWRRCWLVSVSAWHIGQVAVTTGSKKINLYWTGTLFNVCLVTNTDSGMANLFLALFWLFQLTLLSSEVFQSKRSWRYASDLFWSLVHERFSLCRIYGMLVPVGSSATSFTRAPHYCHKGQVLLKRVLICFPISCCISSSSKSLSAVLLLKSDIKQLSKIWLIIVTASLLSQKRNELVVLGSW